MGLRAKLYIPLLLLSVLVASYVYGIWMPQSLEDAEKGYRSLLEKHLSNVADGLVPLMLGRQLDAVYGNLDHLLDQNNDWLDIRLFDADGRFLYPFEAAPAAKNREARDVIILEQEIRHLDVDLGKLIVTVDFTPRLNELRRRNKMLAYILLAVALSFFLTSGLVLERVVRRPIRRLAEVSERLAAGDYAANLPKTGFDEIGTLVSNFAGMRDAVRLHAGRLIDANEDILRLNAELELKVEKRTKQLVAAQDELVRKEKLAILGRLAANVGNELRNPLGVMNNAVFFLKDALSSADYVVGEYLDIIKNEIENVQRTISDFVDFFRTKKPKRQMVALSNIMSESIRQSKVPNTVSFELDIPDTLPIMNIDPMQIRQVFHNLITNAVQAMPGGGSVRVAARQVDNIGGAQRGSPVSSDHTGSPIQETAAFVEVSFTDTGEGISPENMKKLFQPLFSTKSRGVGLGLAICRNFVEANGGTIKVESEAGKGTTFTVVLPAQGGLA